MGAFTPFKRRANSFKYTPRYYDPAKEEREARRAELLGKRLDTGAQEGEEYIPGQYIRTQREARASRRSGDKGVKNPFKVWVMLGAVIVIFILGSMLYERVVSVMMMNGTPAEQTTETLKRRMCLIPKQQLLSSPTTMWRSN